MLPNSPFAQPQSSFKRPVPTPTADPDAAPLVVVAFNRNWLPYVIGSLFQLLQNTTWDAAQGSPDFDLAQNRAANLLQIFSLAQPFTPSNERLTLVEDDMPLFRQQGCLLQVQCSDGTWTTIYDPSACIAKGSSNPSPGTQPPAGTCAEYNASMQASNHWLLPVLVNEGDTLDFTNFGGATNDGSNAEWRCLDGSDFILGGCIGGTITSGGDTIPTAPHLSLIVNIDGTWHSAISGPITVAPGVSGGTVFFAVNDSNIADNSGSVSFHVKYCAQAASAHSISYQNGSGPAAFNYGDTLTMHGTNSGAGNFELTFTLDVAAKVTLLADPGYVLVQAPPVTFATWENPVGTQIGSLADPPDGNPLRFPASTTLIRFHLATAVGGAAFDLQVKIDAP